MIIDCHSHWLPEEIIKDAHFYSRAWGDIESQYAAMERAGIDKALLTYPTSDAHLAWGSFSKVAYCYNDNVAKIIKRYPDTFIGAAILPVDNSADMLKEYKRATQELGFKALSFASSYNGRYLDDPLFRPVYQEAQKDRIPIFVHSQIVRPAGIERIDDPLLTPVIEYIFDVTLCIGKLLMGQVLSDFPDLVFVFAYFGGVTCHLAHRFDATYQMLRKINFVKDLRQDPSYYLKNIYVDTSGDTIPTNFLAALSLLGHKHIVWGSDWPAKKDIGASLSALDGLPISHEQRSDIMGGNASRIFD
jgi:predicted TIM-barrel fold metal-dependent hydrolase